MPNIYSVSEITRQIRDLLELRVGEVWIEGEISNYRKQSSGHHYFTLKDERAQLGCVMFARAYGARTGSVFTDGMQVQVHGLISVYEARGQYQIVVDLIQNRGQGLLQAKFEALKRKLDGEGLFDPAHKKPIPKFPRKIALITSPTGAALQDMLHVLRRRSPWISVLLCPVRVQGEGAALEIANMIREIDHRSAALGIDTVVLARGGGSLEDLWQFNEEVVARTIYEAAVPIIVAVGHEIDFTIVDFVADLRAPTPSAAAELGAPDRVTLVAHLNTAATRLGRTVQQRLEWERGRFLRLEQAPYFRDPHRIFVERRQTADLLGDRLHQLVLRNLNERRQTLSRLGSHLAAFQPRNFLAHRREWLSGLARRLTHAIAQQNAERQLRLRHLSRSLRLLGPAATLDRGYSITRDEHGHLVRSVASLRLGTITTTTVADGDFGATVHSINPLDDTTRNDAV